ncbi:MAG: DDE-type integrase/transposase/recombinase [Nitrospirota bacterium]
MLSPEEKVKLVEELTNEPKLLERLRELGIATSTYYSWKRRLVARGVAAFIAESSAPKSVWNRLSQAERDLIETEARKYTEMSPRLLAWMLLDQHGVAVSESTVYRVLKAKGLVRQRPQDQRPAAKAWKKPTKAVDEIWQMDGTNFFIPEFGYYKAIPVLDDHSRKVLACPLLPDESGQSASDAFEMAMETAQSEGHVIETRPTLLTDNGAGFSGEVLAKYLKIRGVPHIFGAPYHPQTQGKVERFNRTLKERVNLWLYGTPDDLRAAIDKENEEYNERPHEALKNVCPNDVYAGRQEEVLERRAKIRLETMARRYAYNMGTDAGTAN